MALYQSQVLTQTPLPRASLHRPRLTGCLKPWSRVTGDLRLSFTHILTLNC